jgi:hypothetical protein
MKSQPVDEFGFGITNNEIQASQQTQTPFSVQVQEHNINTNNNPSIQ